VRRLLKEHRDVPALERSLGPPPDLDRVSEVEQVAQLGRIEIGDIEEVAAHQSAH
jgi:hypothetical protein